MHSLLWEDALSITVIRGPPSLINESQSDTWTDRAITRIGNIWDVHSVEEQECITGMKMPVRLLDHAVEPSIPELNCLESVRGGESDIYLYLARMCEDPELSVKIITLYFLSTFATRLNDWPVGNRRKDRLEGSDGAVAGAVKMTRHS